MQIFAISYEQKFRNYYHFGYLFPVGLCFIYFFSLDSPIARASDDAQRCGYALKEAQYNCDSGRGFECGFAIETVKYDCFVYSLKPYWCDLGSVYRDLACEHLPAYQCGVAKFEARSRCDEATR